MTIESINDLKIPLYGETLEQLQARAKRHLKEWRPTHYAALRKAGELHGVTLLAAERAFEQINWLMSQGYQRHEAEEVVLPELILVPPEQEVINHIEADEL